MKNVKKIISIAMIGLMMALCLAPVVSGSSKVNINTDGIEQLITLKRVGEKIAERIIEYRKVHPFQVPEDLMNVKGIGQKVFDANKDRIIVKDE